MCPDLSYIMHYLIGTQPDNAFSIIKTFGLLLVIAILTAAMMLMKEMRRDIARVKTLMKEKADG